MWISSDNAFDCIWAYHVISHTDTEGFLKINLIRHIDECYFETRKQNSVHYYIEAKLNKSKNELDYSNIIGKNVSGTIDRPLGTAHPKHSDILIGLIIPKM